MVRGLVVAILGFCAATVAGYAIVFFGTSLVWELMGVHDRDGGGHMALGLVIAPIAGLITGVVGAALAVAFDIRRRRDAPPPGELATKGAAHPLILVAGAAAGAFVGYIAGRIGYSMIYALFPGRSFLFWLLTWIPTLAMLGGAWGGVVAAKRFARRQPDRPAA